MGERYVRFRRGGPPEFGVLAGERVAVLSGPGWAGGAPTGEVVALDRVRLLAPSAPRYAVGVGLNYHGMLGGKPPRDPPPLFVKPVADVAGPDDVIRLPEGANDVIAEGEMVVVVGRELRHAGAAQARAGIFGVTAGNDVTVRNWLRSAGDWWRAKGSDTFTVAGPAIVTGVDPGDLAVTVGLNGAEAYRGSTRDLVVAADELVAYVSRYVTLRPGDWVFTGTPGRGAPLRDGDEVTVEVAGAGVLRNQVAASTRVPPTRV